jgi:SAM-dependent methyltransferase
MQSDGERAFIEAATAAPDRTFKAKFVDLPRFFDEWSEPIGGLAGKRVLDFGCGNGTTACAVALTRRPELVVGIDIDREFDGCLKVVSRHVPITQLPQNLVFEQVAPGTLGNYAGYDFIYSWSVFEHIDQRLFDHVVQALREKLKPSGCLFVQIGPLFYSAEGSHLMGYGLTNWEHLSLQFNDLKRRVYSHPTVTQVEKDRDWQCFETLNKLTAPELIRRVCKNGFSLIRDYYTRDPTWPPDEVLSVYNGSIVTTKQIVAVFRRAS